MNKYFKNINLLTISHSYRYFIKDRIEMLAPNFNNIYSCIRHNLFAESSLFFKSSYLKKYSKKNIINSRGIPHNVFVYPTTLLYLPVDFFYKRLGYNHYMATKKVVNKNDIHFDLIHSHFIWSSGYVGSMLKRDFDVPLIITAHGYDVYNLPFIDDTWNFLIKDALNSSNHVITVSNKNKKILESLNIKSKISVIPNGYNKKLFYPMDKTACRIRLGLPINKKIFLSVGSLKKIKGYSYLIESLKLLKMRYNNFLCLIIGAGDLRPLLLKQIKKANLEKEVLLIGSIPHEQISFWMNSADLFVLPSLNEGNPTVMFEALACGLPYVGTKVGGVPEIINDSSTGVLVSPKNSEGLNDALYYGINRDWDIQQIISYSKNFSYDFLMRKVLSLYKHYIINN